MKEKMKLRRVLSANLRGMKELHKISPQLFPTLILHSLLKGVVPYVYHLFKNELGQTPIHFLNSIRINVAMEYLENTSYSIATVSKMACFNSENHFRKVFFDAVGTTPMKFRQKKV